ncbi:MAG TPA: CHAT domain-containing protein [Lapillicoccus sp.]|nr:CHAT domain-containing protein [Lapillicoccus sp.]
MLLPLALSRPGEARERALAVLASSPSARQASIAHQTVAIVDRDAGRLADALASARTALKLARRVDAQREADVLATLGGTLVFAGRTTAGLRRLDEAERITTEENRPRLLVRRAHLRYLAGQFPAAITELGEAIAGSHASGDLVWEARAHNTRCLAELAIGDTAAAEADAAAALALFDRVNQRLESIFAIHNRALALHQRGSLPAALELMDEVSERYVELGATPADLVIDHAQMLLTAGLFREARDMTITALGSSQLQSVKRAEILLTAAQAALADGDIDAAEVDGDLAGRLFAAQQRPAWAHRARLLSLQAQYLADHPDQRDLTLDPSDRDAPDVDQRRRQQRLLRSSAELVEQMRTERAVELPVALLLHGRIAEDAKRPDEAKASYAEAATSRHTAFGLARAAGWLAAALLADLENDRRALLHACRRGLDSVDEYRALLGDLELRALATRHGAELAAMALRSAERRGDARGMLWWIERWRATALAVPRPPPSPDHDLDRQVSALRDVVRRLDSADGSTSDALRQERDRLEARVRRTRRRQRADGARAATFDLGAIRGELGDTVLLVLVTIDGQLSALTLADGRIRRRAVGPLATALREARFTRFALRRTAYGRLADIPVAAARLQHALLGDPAAEWSRPRVVVVPTADLLTAPWGVLPVFADSVVTVAPSATLWSQARRRRDETGHIALVTGPDLSSGENEVTALSPLHDRARAVGGAEATVAGALATLQGARLAHIAAHGTFRADAPMFSSLRLHDGPLTIHDLDRLDRPPAEMVLSACDSGNAAPIGAHEALGLVSSLLAMGTSSVLASVVPVNDQATVGVMRNVHDVVGRGGSLAEGWLAARQTAADPLERATAGAFTAWGA